MHTKRIVHILESECVRTMRPRRMLYLFNAPPTAAISSGTGADHPSWRHNYLGRNYLSHNYIGDFLRDRCRPPFVAHSAQACVQGISSIDMRARNLLHEWRAFGHVFRRACSADMRADGRVGMCVAMHRAQKFPH